MSDMITSDRLQWLLDIVERSLAEPNLNGEQLAGQAHLSRFHFDRLVAAALGESPGTLRRRLLMERAAHQARRRATSCSARAARTSIHRAGCACRRPRGAPPWTS
jgi:AraC family transcriptional regulator